MADSAENAMSATFCLYAFLNIPPPYDFFTFLPLNQIALKRRIILVLWGADTKDASMTRRDLQKLARLRLREAEALYKAHFFDGCVYLAGYAVELALKAKICRLLHVKEYPLSGDIGRAFKVHSLDQLKVLAGLSVEIDVEKNKELFDNWSKAVEWDPEQRYDKPGKYNATAAKVILDGLTSKPNGVFTWLSRRW